MPFRAKGLERVIKEVSANESKQILMRSVLKHKTAYVRRLDYHILMSLIRKSCCRQPTIAKHTVGKS